jgi:hypothetical protein
LKSSLSWGNLVILVGTIFVGFAIPHLIDDFLFEVPDEFGLSNVQAQSLVGVSSALLIVVFSLAARGKRCGYIGAGFLGAFVALAGTVKRIPRILKPSPYWSGLFSELLIIVVIVSGISLLIVSVLAHRCGGQTGSGE